MAHAPNRAQLQASDDEPEAKMGFLDHLDELRRRLIKSCIALGAGMVFAFFFVDGSWNRDVNRHRSTGMDPLN
jgi:Sec-independent protein secretion pathway component TatC